MSTPLHIFKPSLKAFGLRCVGLFLLTYLMLTPAWPFVGGLAATAAAIVLTLTYMFVLDDFTDWLHHRHATWTLTSTTLTYENPTEDMMLHSLNLSDIKSVKRRFFWSVHIRLHNGQAVTMPYMNNPKHTRDLILNTMQSQAFT